MKLSNVDKAVYNTLVYSTHFAYPLTKEEIYLKQHSSFIFSQKEINQSIYKLLAAKIIFCKQNYYFINQKKLQINIKNRIEKEKISTEKLKFARKTLDKITKISWVKAILITGSVAAKNANKEDDIDILIITADNRLWLVRLIVIMFLELKKIRRRPDDKNFADKICFNMVLDGSFCLIPFQNQNIYTAHELLQSILIYEYDNCYYSLLKQNQWVNQFAANWYQSRLKQISLTKNVKIGNFFINKLLTKLNYLFYRLQKVYMQPKITKEFVNLHQALFHPSNISAQITRSYHLSKMTFS